MAIAESSLAYAAEPEYHREFPAGLLPKAARECERINSWLRGHAGQLVLIQHLAKLASQVYAQDGVTDIAKACQVGILTGEELLFSSHPRDSLLAFLPTDRYVAELHKIEQGGLSKDNCCLRCGSGYLRVDLSKLLATEEQYVVVVGNRRVKLWLKAYRPEYFAPGSELYKKLC